MVIVQTIFAAWNYSLAPADITGRCEAKTAQAAFSYRLDNDLSQPIADRESFAKKAQGAGVFDDKTLRAFDNRLAAKNYRSIRAIDAKRGVRFHLTAGATPASALTAIFPDDERRGRSGKWKVSIDTTDAAAAARGEAVAWLPIQGYVCGSATTRDACNP